MLTADDVRKRLKAAVNGNQAAWASSRGLSVTYVNDTLHGRRLPGKAVLKALGLRRVVGYEPIEAAK